MLRMTLIALSCVALEGCVVLETVAEIALGAAELILTGDVSSSPSPSTTSSSSSSSPPQSSTTYTSSASSTSSQSSGHIAKRVAGANMTECVHYDASEKRFYNRCTKKVEIHWRTAESTLWSQGPIHPNDWRQNYAGRVIDFHACLPGHSFDRELRQCYFWDYGN